MSINCFDTHCHLSFHHFKGRPGDVIQRASEAGVDKLITVACAVSHFEPTKELLTSHPGLWATAGIHPHDADKTEKAHYDLLQEMWSTPRVIAAGEMGLDYHYDFSSKKSQQQVFEEQLQLAVERKLPIVVHSREAHADTVAMLNNAGLGEMPVVFHSFSGNAAEATEVLDHGWYVSYSGIATFKNAKPTQEALQKTPADRLFFETDAPYLSPEPVRSMRPNEPANVVHTIRFAASLRHEDFETLSAQATRNAIEFFNLDL